ncbi:hypothetical protein AUJ42_01955 [Candidatus Collierbacteria bacterium CG1_02_44_10]|uniref:Uncharacterized protein n=1 Tax=Candidatus Collierbacteria bacterium CG1_02_44_10 TaxID=1805087 RepID=A0A1J4RXY9_9BACT|nr:MAG: hypothetical protein AUJ42_01955 [Candidatus Collierbacteria bacterium CG1_02_44_10]
MVIRSQAFWQAQGENPVFVDRKVQRLYAWLRLGDEIVQASAKAGGTCKEDVTGSSPVGGALTDRNNH